MPLQQPVGQEVASQKHCPLMQCCPGLQAGCAPQLQVPSALHVSVVMVAHEWQIEPPCPHGQRPPPRGQGPGITVRQAEPEQHPMQVALVQLLQRPSAQVWVPQF